MLAAAATHKRLVGEWLLCVTGGHSSRLTLQLAASSRWCGAGGGAVPGRARRLHKQTEAGSTQCVHMCVARFVLLLLLLLPLLLKIGLMVGQGGTWTSHLP